MSCASWHRTYFPQQSTVSLAKETRAEEQRLATLLQMELRQTWRTRRTTSQSARPLWSSQGVTADSKEGAVADATADSFAALAVPSLLSASSGSVSCFDTDVLRGRLSFQRGGRNDVRLSGSWPNDVGTSRRATETGASMDMLVLYESGGASLDSARDSGRASERVSGLAAGTGTSVEDTRVSALGMFHVHGDSARASTALNKGDVSEAREDLRDELATSLAIVANGSDSSLERIRGFVEGRVLGSSVSILRFGAAVSDFVGSTAAVDSIFGT